jgi:hypothetical protein
VAMDLNVGGNIIVCGPGVPAAPNNPLAEFCRSLTGAELWLTVDTRDMQVTHLEGAAELRRKLEKLNPQLRDVLAVTVREEGLIGMAQPVLGAAPGKAVRPGEKWTRKRTLDLGPLGSCDITDTYTLEGREPGQRRLYRIKASEDVRWKAPAAKAGGGLPFVVKALDVTEAGGSGTVLFNRARGRVERWAMRTSLVGQVQIRLGDQDMAVALDQVQEITVETTDENPLPRKK